MARNRGAAVAAPAGGDSVTTQRMRIPTNGPHDGDTLAPEITPAPGTVDFGAVRVPVPAGGTVSVEPTTAGRIQAVHVTVPEGRLSVSALAAPRNEGLWPELATEIDASLREGGARVRSFTGEWGRELHATTDGATSVFVGVDGPRWMLYGVATGPTRDAVSLDARLRRMLRGTVVVRGKAPYPVRTVLPLVTPSGAGVEEPAATSAPPTMTLRAPAAAEGVLDASGPTNGAAAPGAPVVAATTGATNGAVSGAVNGAAAHDAGGSPPDGATSGVFRRNGVARRPATRKDVPLPGASTTGVTRTGATPGASGPATPPPRSGPARRRQAGTAPGVPFPGASTNGAATGANRRGPASGAGRTGATTGANRTGIPTAGGGTTGANPIGPPGAHHGASSGQNPAGGGVNRREVPTGFTPAGGATTGANQIGAPGGFTPASGATTGANQIGVPGGFTPAAGTSTGANHIGAANGYNPATGANHIGAANGYAPAAGATTGANHVGAPSGYTPAGSATTGTNHIGAHPGGAASGANQIGASTGFNPTGATTSDTNQLSALTGYNPGSGGPVGAPTGATDNGAAAGAGRPGAADGANRRDGSSPTGTTWSGAYPPGRPAVAEAGTSPYGVPADDPSVHHAAPPWSSTPVPTGAFPTAGTLGGHTVSGSSRTPAPPDAVHRPETNGAPLGRPAAAGLSRADVPPAWAHQTGMDSFPAVDGGLPTPHYEPGPQQPELAPFTSVPADRRSWADAPSDRAAAGRWDPLVDPLPIDLEPLPAPDPVWADDGAGSAPPHRRGARQDAGAPTNGTAARRWRAADLLRDRDAETAADGGDTNARRWRAADLLVGRDDPPAATDGATPTWRAADLLNGNAVPRSHETGRSNEDVAARGHDNGRAATDVPATRWRAADLLDGSEGRTRRGRATEPSERQQVNGHAEPRRRAALSHDDSHGTTRWRAADLLDGGAEALLDGGAEAEPRWRAARLLEGRGAQTAAASWDTGAAPDRLIDGTGDDPPARKWRGADLLDVEAEQSAHRRRARTPAARPVAEDAADAPAGRRRRSASSDDLPAGRRHAPTPTDAPSRHGGENRHAGPPSRVPPTQWAWPKEPAPEPPPTRRAADTGNGTAWSASDLLDEGRHAGGRRRAPESARHGAPPDDAAGRHYRP